MKTVKIKSGNGYYIVEVLTDETIDGSRTIRGRYFYKGKILPPKIYDIGAFPNIKEEPEIVNKTIEELFNELS